TVVDIFPVFKPRQDAEKLLRLAIRRWKSPRNPHVLACTLRFLAAHVDDMGLVLPALITFFSTLPTSNLLQRPLLNNAIRPTRPGLDQHKFICLPRQGRRGR